MTNTVIHFTGKGRIFKVTDESKFCWRIFMSDLEQECWVPKTEYIDANNIKSKSHTVLLDRKTGELVVIPLVCKEVENAYIIDVSCFMKKDYTLIYKVKGKRRKYGE